MVLAEVKPVIFSKNLVSPKVIMKDKVVVWVKKLGVLPFHSDVCGLLTID
mgnify:CR=1 FL=1